MSIPSSNVQTPLSSTHATPYDHDGLQDQWFTRTAQSTPSLSNFSFTNFGRDHEPNSSHRPGTKYHILELPNLRKINWIAYTIDSSPFFYSVVAPKLAEIKYQCDTQSWISDEPIQHFLRRSRCAITKEVRLAISSPAIISSFLSILHDAEEVRITWADADISLMRTLTLDKSSSAAASICPKMKRLVMENLTMERETYDSFVKMAQSRLRGTLDLLEGDGGSGEPLSSLQVFVYSDKTYYLAPLCMSAAYRLLVKMLSPKEWKLITYEERVEAGWRG